MSSSWIYRQGAAERASLRKQNAIAEAEGLRRVPEPKLPAGLSYRPLAGALDGVDRFSTTGRLLVPAQIGRILQRLGLFGKFLGSDQAWVAV